MTISEIQELEDGMHVDRLQGKLIKVFERESKTDKKNRPYTLQNGEVEENGNSIRVSFWNHKDLTSYRGQVIVIRSVAPKSFVSVKHYKDKAQLSVPGQAIVLSESEESDDIPMDYPEKLKTVDVAGYRMIKQENPPKANVEPKKAIPEGGVNVVKHRLMQMVKFRALCDASVEYLYGDGASEEMKKDVSSCFFIQGMREGLEKQLPDNKPLSKKENVEATEDLEKKEDEIF